MADPYKPANVDNETVSSKEKIEGLMAFAEGVNLGMMTTRQNESGLLVSRCMALAAKENGVDLIFHTNTETHKTDELMADSHVNIAFIKSGSVSFYI
jgi:general stress protein 26